MVRVGAQRSHDPTLNAPETDASRLVRTPPERPTALSATERTNPSVPKAAEVGEEVARSSRSYGNGSTRAP